MMTIKTLMAKTLIAVLAALCLAAITAPAQAEESPVDHGAYAAFLEKYVVVEAPGVTGVRYGAVTREDSDALKTYIEYLGALDPAAMSRDEAYAYWVNLYNALTVNLVIDAYPVDSIRDIRFGLGLRPGPWREPLIKVAGEALSLDDIEHGILRKEWDEPRVHFAVNCASVGCPALLAEPFTADTLEEQLEAATRGFINTPRAVRFEEGELIVSSLFKWYEEDFGDSEGAVIDFLKTYADAPLRAALDGAGEIDGYEYDWSLNGAE